MALHIYRVTVRGLFDHPGDACRDALITEAPDHAVAQATFTRDGTLTYDLPLVSFSFRYEIRVDGAEHDPPEVEAATVAEHRARTTLTARAIPFRRLRIQATDMADVWQRSGR